MELVRFGDRDERIAGDSDCWFEEEDGHAMDCSMEPYLPGSSHQVQPFGIFMAGFTHEKVDMLHS